MNHPLYDNFILSNAMKFDIPSDWISAIIEQESNWNTYAVRYEPTYPYIFHASEFAHRLVLSIETETQCQKMSWGLGQLMGALARELGHQGPMGQLFDPETNIGFLARRLSQLKKISPLMEDIFAGYNGGPGAMKKVNDRYPNQGYVDSVKKHLQLSKLH